MPKEPLFAVFFHTIARKVLPRPMPRRSPVPDSSLCIPRSDAAASEPGRDAQPDTPSHGEKENAARCDDECSALRWRMQCTAWAHAPHCVFGGITAGLGLQLAEGGDHRRCQCPRKGFPRAIISAKRDVPKPWQGRGIGLRHLFCSIRPGEREWCRGGTSILYGLFCLICQRKREGYRGWDKHPARPRLLA